MSPESPFATPNIPIRLAETGGLRELGPYRVIGQLGEGGMGVVYLAEQESPVERMVALKLARVDVAAERIARRFEAEPRALARLNHRHIAQIYEVGVTATGAPFMAMEYIDGSSLVDYCDAKRRSLHDRLELFLQVCSAVQHIHNNGLIHRDLKPANILVSLNDKDEPTAKIIDFGIAKGFEQPLSAETLTRGEFVGTPLYVAPEVLRGEPVDTRADIYTLGLVLYRLLAGVSPIERSPAESPVSLLASLAEGAHITPPSRRLERLKEAEREEATVRMDTSYRTWHAVMRRDLDWVVMKALAPIPEDRYGSAAALAAELERFENGDPVEARPAAFVYRTAKLASKHSWPLFGAAAVLSLLAIGFGSTVLAAQRASQHSADAKARLALAVEQRNQAELAKEYVVLLLRDANPYITQADRQHQVHVLAAAQASLARADITQLHRAAVLFSFGRVYVGLGEMHQAREMAKECLSIRNATLTPADPLAVDAMALMALTDNADGSVEQLRHAMLLYDGVQGLDTEFLGRRWVRSEGFNRLGSVALLRGDGPGAEAWFRRSLALYADSEHPRAVFARALLGRAVSTQGRHQEALSLLADAHSVEARRSDTNAAVHVLSRMLGDAHMGEGSPEVASQWYESGLAGLMAELGPNHEQTRVAQARVNELQDPKAEWGAE